jgi:hypothetical protein
MAVGRLNSRLLAVLVHESNMLRIDARSMVKGRHSDSGPSYCAMQRALAAVHGRGPLPKLPQNHMNRTTRADIVGTSRRPGA